MKVAFRVDASIQIGSGHVMRCLTLAKELEVHNHQIYFICRELNGNLFELIKNEGFPILKLPNMKEKVTHDLFHSHWLEVRYKTDAKQTIDVIKDIDILIVDHYALDFKWENMLRNFVGKIFVIDDLADRVHNCDFLLDQNYYINMNERYENLLPSQTVKLIGPYFSLIRNEFITARKRLDRKFRDKNVMVFFGGSDPTNLTLKVILELKKIHQLFNKIFVVVGKNNLEKEKIQDFCKKNSGFEYHYQIDYMADLMRDSIFAICAAGSTTWERYCIGLPGLVFAVAENQFEVLKSLDVLGIDCFIGKSSNFSYEVLNREINHFLNMDLSPRVCKAMEVVDGLGKKRILEVLEKELI